MQFLVVDRCRNHLADLLSSWTSYRKSGVWRWNFDAVCQSSTDVIISGCGSHIDFSDCRLLLFLAETIFHLCIRGLIPQICHWNFNCTLHSLRVISISGFGRHFRLSVIIGITCGHFQRVGRGWMPWVRRWNVDDMCRIFEDVTILPLIWLPS